ncbi:HNH endonuclease family protein [Cellulosimicrobium marinum]|uniref:HNH endonuclease family protein n=1 Tax=Cellulosimicrobium marinum TaxID=1638992 RepID=UPI001E2F5B3C|nr:HNH endonuclease family protein [Cellulosimicrobium marinum]MCB7135484.1 HNH endonuclease family protein [Cellulosimicrobium marinum]
MSTSIRRVTRRTALRYALVALALLIVLANVLDDESAAVDAPEPAPVAGTALAALATLEVKGPAADTGYERSEFGSAWVDVDGNGCDTRNDILARDLADLTFSTRDEPCQVRTGTFVDPYTGESIDFRRGNATSSAVQIDHVVALLDAWRKGAQGWDDETRTRFANDPLNLLAADGPANQAKGARDASAWLPPNHAFRCPYVARQIAVKSEYGLAVTPSESEAMAHVLADCPAEPVPAG